MIKVFIAGPYSGDNIITILDNIRRGQRLAKTLMYRGYAPYCPFLDYQLALQLDEDETMPVDYYQKVSIAFLKDCDAMILLPGWQNSGGTLNEINISLERGIEIYSSLDAFELLYPKTEYDLHQEIVKTVYAKQQGG